MINITVAQEIFAPAHQIVEVLLNHAQLERFFNAQISLVKPENKGAIKGGQGAIRHITIGNIKFEEQIVSASYEHICYQIIGNKPVANHQGNIYLNTNDITTDLSTTSANNNHEVNCNKGSQRTHLQHSEDNTGLTDMDLTKQNYTRVNYVIKFSGLVWLPDFLLKFLVKRDIRIAMQRLADYFKKQQLLSKSSTELT